jgi:murein DD-endopeptidase MepM/ murein hydrolase activator NlpD
MVGAGVVALAAGAVIPESTGVGRGDPTTQAMSVNDRLNALDKANRSDDRPGTAFSVEQGAPDVWLLPLRTPYTITTLYEMRWGSFHTGVDLAAPYSTPFYASHSGTVIVSRYYGGYGNCVIVDVGNGIQVYYGHASGLAVTEGEHVEAGTLLGYVGSTGYSTGNHLHFEVRDGGAAVDPMNFMLAHGVDIPKRLEAASGGLVIIEPRPALRAVGQARDGSSSSHAPSSL